MMTGTRWTGASVYRFLKDRWCHDYVENGIDSIFLFIWAASEAVISFVSFQQSAVICACLWSFMIVVVVFVYIFVK